MITERLAFGLNPALVGIDHGDQVLLDRLMCAHPQWRNVVELGTYTGITAMFLGLTCRLRGGQVWTINKTDDRIPEVKSAWLPNMAQVLLDLLSEGLPNEEAGEIIRQAAPCLVIFDNGNKPEEVRRYARYVQPGSGIAVHDFNDDPLGNEVTWPDVKDVLGTPEWADVALEDRRTLKSSFRCWERI